jgi:histone deacetylase HOS3
MPAVAAYLRHGIDRVVILDIGKPSGPRPFVSGSHISSATPTDLHHGNGTQEIALRLNEDTYREELLVAGGKPAEAKRGLKVFYGSVHDIVRSSPLGLFATWSVADSEPVVLRPLTPAQYSFPCEDGNLERVKDASLNLAAHGQYMSVAMNRLAYVSPSG